MNTRQKTQSSGLGFLALTLLLVSFTCHGAESPYNEEQIYRGRPKADREPPFGHVGVTGVMVRVYRDTVTKDAAMASDAILSVPTY